MFVYNTVLYEMYMYFMYGISNAIFFFIIILTAIPVMVISAKQFETDDEYPMYDGTTTQTE